MKTHRPVTALAAALLLACGCDARSPLAPQRPATEAATARAAPARGPAALDDRHLEGQLGPGALYSIDVPATWNGDLVLYSHGYTLPQEPVALPTTDNFANIRDGLLARGFALAATSFSENGYVVAEGARQLHQLRGVFSDRVAVPRHTYLLGYSMGGLIALQLVETHATQFDGALLVSGVVGGTRAEVRYIGDVRLLFDALFPCPLPGGVTDVPDQPFPLAEVFACVSGNPLGIGAMACSFRDPRFPLPGRNGPELAQTILRVLGFHWFAAEDLFDRTHGHQLYDNHDVVYTSCAPGVNERVTRYTSTPDAENFMRLHYEPSGALQIPVLTLHALHDPVVPSGHEILLREKAEAAGCAQNLVQRLSDRYGHTEAFTAAEVLAAFDDLVTWRSSTQKPRV